MRVPIKVKYGKQAIKGTIPQEWNDVSFKDYVNFLKASEEGKITKVYESLTRIPVDMWEKPHKAELFTNIDKVLAFTSVIPSCELPTHIERGGEFWEINDDFMTLPLSQYRDMIEVISSLQKEDEEISDIENVSVIPKLISIIACKEYKNMAQIERISSEIEEMPCDIVLTIGGFFLKKLTVLREWNKKETEHSPITSEQAQAGYSEISSDFGYLYALYNLSKGDFTKSKIYCRRLWVRCTGGVNYRVVSVPQIKDIKK